MTRSSLNPTLLLSLEVLLATRNLSHAAKQLGVTQSALSRHLAQLREQFGDPLLVRSGRHYVLTARAAELVGPVKRLLADMETLLSPERFDPSTCARRFELAASDYVAEYMLPELMTRLAPLAPKLGLRLRLWEPGQFALLADAGLDLVITTTDEAPPDLHGRMLGEDKPVCGMRAGHPLAAAPLTLDGYLSFPHARIYGGGDKDSFVDRHLSTLGRTREIRLAVPFFSSALRAVSSTDLLVTLPEHIAEHLSREFPITWRPLPFDVYTHRYWLLWHARVHHDPAHRWLRSQVFEVVDQSRYGVSRFLRGGA